METAETRTIKKARKRHTCDWCYGYIDKGTSYKTYFCFGEALTVRMHPECYHAMLMNSDLTDDIELPPAGYFRRGCWCGEIEEHCECAMEDEM